jgi:type III restriction enzyme
MGSEIAVEQVIGRVLRQPNCRYYREEDLNEAYFHLRVDEDKVFRKIIDELKSRLAETGNPIKIRTEKIIDKIDIKAKKTRKVPILA